MGDCCFVYPDGLLVMDVGGRWLFVVCLANAFAIILIGVVVIMLVFDET